MKPGTYDLNFFVAFTYSDPNNPEKNYSATLPPGFAPKLSIKGGEILYIGDFYIDITKSLNMEEAAQIKYSDKDMHLPVLRKKYPAYFKTETNLGSKIMWRKP